MPGLGPGIHELTRGATKNAEANLSSPRPPRLRVHHLSANSWMPGPSPGMTMWWPTTSSAVVRRARLVGLPALGVVREEQLGVVLGGERLEAVERLHARDRVEVEARD